MVYSPDHGYPVHRDCENFNNGLCTLSDAAVDPYGPACPRFTPKSTTKTLQAEAAYPKARRSYQIYPPQMGQGQPTGRRGGRGRGMGGGRGMGRVRGIAAYPYHPPMQMQTPSSTVRAQEKEALTQQLEELEKQLKEVRGRLEKLR
jgi:hypothetical protein